VSRRSSLSSMIRIFAMRSVTTDGHPLTDASVTRRPAARTV
jgi:hypothetical protein